eukprot:CFRG0140T1
MATIEYEMSGHEPTRHNFAEAAEIEEIIQRLSVLERFVSSNNIESHAPSASECVKEATRHYRRFAIVIDSYLESAHQLDTHLEGMVTSLLSTALKCGNNPKRRIQHLDLKSIDEDRRTIERSEHDGEVGRQQSDLTKFMHIVFKCLNVLIKVRGYKVVITFFMHDVVDLQTAVNILRDQNPDVSEGWETSFVLLLWLSLIAMVPFDLKSVYEGDCGEISLLSTAVSLGRKFLLTAHKCNEGAGIMLSRFLTRTGADRTLQMDTMSWLTTTVSSIAHDPTHATSVHYIVAILRMLAETMRVCPREEAVQTFAPTVFVVADMCMNNCEIMKQHTVHKLLIKMESRAHLAYFAPRIHHWRYQRGNRFVLMEGGGVGTRTANASESMSVNSHLNGSNDTTKKRVHANRDTRIGKCEELSVPVGMNLRSDMENHVNEHDDVPERMEDFISQLLTSLDHTETGVRWAAAKAIGRLTERLPTEDMADDICCSVLELFTESLSHTLWQGGCLALSELAIRGVMQTTHLSHLVAVLCRCLDFDIVVGTKPVGAAVRDAACYLAWALARAYNAAHLKSYLHDISTSLVVVMCFDREINCRKAASAAFQEHVGRQGTFEHGIDILTKADYFSVGNRHNSFCSVAPFIARYSQYRAGLLENLFNEKLLHWDQKVREVSAKSIGEITICDPFYVLNTAIPKLIDQCGPKYDMGVRHGSLLGLASALSALCRTKSWFNDLYNTPEGHRSTEAMHDTALSVLYGIADLVETLSQPQQSSGRVSNINFRVASCMLVKSICLSSIRLPSPRAATQTPTHIHTRTSMQTSITTQTSEYNTTNNSRAPVSASLALQRIIQSNLEHTSEDVQKAAADAFAVLCRAPWYHHYYHDNLRDVAECKWCRDDKIFYGQNSANMSNRNGDFGTAKIKKRERIYTGQTDVQIQENAGTAVPPRITACNEGCLVQDYMLRFLYELNSITACGAKQNTIESNTRRIGYLRALVVASRTVLVVKHIHEDRGDAVNTCSEKNPFANIANVPTLTHTRTNTRTPACLSIDVLRCLSRHTTKLYDVETRIVALNGLVTVCREIGFGSLNTISHLHRITKLAQTASVDTAPVNVRSNTSTAKTANASYIPMSMDFETLDMVCDSIITALTDTTTDHRGDVGSDVRAAGVNAVAELLPLMYKQYLIVLKTEQSTKKCATESIGMRICESVDVGVCEVAANVIDNGSGVDADRNVAGNRDTAKCEEIRHHTVSVGGYATQLCKNVIGKCDDVEAVQSSSQRILSSMRCKLMVGYVMEQAMSRIDKLRQKSGMALSALVWCDDPEMRCIPSLFELRDMLQDCRPEKDFNWGSIQAGLSVMVRALNIPTYRKNAIFALILCVGAGNESALRYSQDLLDKHCLSISADEILDIVDTICTICVSEAKHNNDRVVVPCLETLDCLLSRSIAPLMSGHGDSNFITNIFSSSTRSVHTEHSEDIVVRGASRAENTFTRILDTIRPHSIRCSNLKKLSAVSSVMCQLLQCKAVQSRALGHISVILGHRFPHIRAIALDHLYLAFITYDEHFNKPLDVALDILDKIRGAADIAEARIYRNELCLELNIPPPKAVVKQ